MRDGLIRIGTRSLLETPRIDTFFADRPLVTRQTKYSERTR